MVDDMENSGRPVEGGTSFLSSRVTTMAFFSPAEAVVL